MLFKLHLDSVRESQPCRRPAFPVFSLSIPIVFQLQMHLLEALWKIERSLDLKWTHTNCESICWELYNCPFCVRGYPPDISRCTLPAWRWNWDVATGKPLVLNLDLATKHLQSEQAMNRYEPMVQFFFCFSKTSIFTLLIYICILYM